MLIKQVAVIGSGVMGAGIAAHIANSGTRVLLYDIVPDTATDRHKIAKAAIERLQTSEPAAFSHQHHVKLITPCNLEDDLELLKNVDWVIEAVLERLDVKQALYSKLEQFCSNQTIISSNTSTIPLASLVAGRSTSFKQHFMITHFFNPPRYMKLLEIVTSQDVLPEVSKTISEFGSVRLGKSIVQCHDTPGFIANRIGCFWLELGLKTALEQKVDIAYADQIISSNFAIPRTGIFGLMDLIGIDLMGLIAKSFMQTLPATDEFCQNYQQDQVIKNMIAAGYTGRKGKGGFYRMTQDGGKKTKQVIDLITGQYHDEMLIELPKYKHLTEAMQDPYVNKVMLGTLAYAARLVPEITDTIYGVDEAMRAGFNWQLGPFEIIDKLGADFVVAQLREQGLAVPDLLSKAVGRKFYDQSQYLATCGNYQKMPVNPDELDFNLVTKAAKPVFTNQSASLWDSGDGVAIMEFTSKAGILNNDIFRAFEQIMPLVKKDFKALVLGKGTGNFCAGADLKFVLEQIEQGNWQAIEEFIELGQSVMLGLKYAPFPVISAVSGYALGGGAELLLHSSRVIGHLESNIGLVETGVGLIPGWGGCTELLYRSAGSLEQVAMVFTNILEAKLAKSAHLAQDMLLLTPQDLVVMNSNHVLSKAKEIAELMSQNYQAKQPENLQLPAGLEAHLRQIMAKQPGLSEHDQLIAEQLITVLTAEASLVSTEKQLLWLEKTVFVELCKTTKTKERIAHMLASGKPLKN